MCSLYVSAEPTAPHAVQRLCTQLSQWTLSDDAALILLMGYLWHQASLGLVGQLGPEGLGRQEHRNWTDADRNGDPNTTKCTSGLFIELFASDSEHSVRLWLRWKLDTRMVAASFSLKDLESGVFIRCPWVFRCAARGLLERIIFDC